MARNKREFKFRMVNEPSEELIEEFHKSMAESLIAKFGTETMKEVVRQIEEKENTRDKEVNSVKK